MSLRKKIILAVIVLLVVIVAVPTIAFYYLLRANRRNASLITAIKANDTRRVLMLLSQGADANSVAIPAKGQGERSFGDTLLGNRDSGYPQAILVALGWRDAGLSTFTMVPENTTVIGALLDSGANLNVRDRYGDTPLILAIWSGEREVARLLLTRGADIYAVDKKGQTAWRLSYLFQDHESMEVMATRGVDINQQDSAGNCALIWCAVHGDLSAVRLLLAHHANVHIVDANGKSAIDYA